MAPAMLRPTPWLDRVLATMGRPWANYPEDRGPQSAALYSITPELLYTGRKNIELRTRAIFLAGGAGTDFGEKHNERRIEMLARF